MSGLSENDRNAVVLRFFESKSFQEVGASLGTSEDAAKMRVHRAVEKLRKLLAQRGVAFPVAVLTGSLAAHSVQAAPMGLAASVTASVLHGSSASASLLTLIKGTLKVMAWTKAKTAAAVAVGVLFVTGTATVTVKKVMDHSTYAWQMQNMNTDILKQVPPQVHIVPSKFPTSGSCAVNGMVLGIGQSAEGILLAAYDGSPSRLIRTTDLPDKKYDFIANLPHDSRQALQNEIKRKLGLIAHHEILLTNVLQLKVKNAGADGLRPSNGQGGSARTSAGQFSCENQPLSCLAGMLESSLKQPVVDHTGLAGNFDIDLSWDAPNFQRQNPDALKQAIVDELGLELVAATEAIDMLIMLIEAARLWTVTTRGIARRSAPVCCSMARRSALNCASVKIAVVPTPLMSIPIASKASFFRVAAGNSVNFASILTCAPPSNGPSFSAPAIFSFALALRTAARNRVTSSRSFISSDCSFRRLATSSSAVSCAAGGWAWRAVFSRIRVSFSARKRSLTLRWAKRAIPRPAIIPLNKRADFIDFNWSSQGASFGADRSDAVKAERITQACRSAGTVSATIPLNAVAKADSDDENPRCSRTLRSRSTARVTRFLAASSEMPRAVPIDLKSRFSK
jgi:uncharacterized protein (TIGR03435 family)